ncbi:hypothetical protein LJC56_05710 [Christensenellaceae bacterium OttesenSCG-928-K19]|nr:hypothetical protein [Christensenellaceae bacterium OttesenSCG-928-K19]
MNKYQFSAKSWMWDELDKRKELYTRLFAGQSVPFLPVEIRIATPKYTARDYYESAEKQLEDSLESARLTWSLQDKTDHIPALVPDVGCSCLATAFGAEYYMGDDADQTAGIKEAPITDLAAQIEQLSVPELRQSKWLAEGLSRITMFTQAGSGLLPVSGLDAAGGLNVAADLLGITELIMLMVDEPEALHKLLSIIQETYLTLIEAEAQAAGGLEHMTTTDFYAGWAPDGYKGHCSDDISAMISPQMYREFSAPYNAMVYERYGAGGLHNCGPNPCQQEYVAHQFSPRYLDLSEKYSMHDLPELKKSLRKKAFLRFGSEYTDPDVIVKTYRQYMELLAPDVILIPAYTLADIDEGRDLYDRLHPIAVEYASRMDFGFA